jgi:hypothetical protein
MSTPDQPDLSCQDFVEMVTDYLEGDLAPEVVTAIDDHLAVCPGCITVVDQWRRVIELSGELGTQDVDQLPDDLRRDLMSSFRSATDG